MNIKTISLLGFTAALCFAAKGVDIKPALSSPGTVAFQDDFSSGSLSKAWSIAKGNWQVSGGMVVGKEKAEDHHNAVLSLNRPNRNSVIQVSFKLDGADFFHLSYNKEKAHLFRVIVLPGGISIMKDAVLVEPKQKGEVLAKSDTKFESGKWYTMLVEVQGSKVMVQTDNGVKLSGSNPALDVNKVNYRFVTKGATLDLGGVKIWQMP
jgi:hypothetical protein